MEQKIVPIREGLAPKLHHEARGLAVGFASTIQPPRACSSACSGNGGIQGGEPSLALLQQTDPFTVVSLFES